MKHKYEKDEEAIERQRTAIEPRIFSADELVELQINIGDQLMRLVVIARAMSHDYLTSAVDYVCTDPNSNYISKISTEFIKDIFSRRGAERTGELLKRWKWLFAQLPGIGYNADSGHFAPGEALAHLVYGTKASHAAPGEKLADLVYGKKEK